MSATFNRVHRVALLREFANAMLAGQLPSREAQLFIGSAVQAYLTQGGDLERDFLRVKAPQGSHLTPQALASKRDTEE
jgi:hypothetical protein